MRLLTVFVFFYFISVITLADGNNAKLINGPGSFILEMRPGRLISVYYHKPKNFSPQSRILLVVPGAGRNASDYRDSWKENSEFHNVLILSPEYPREDYDFAAYHMGGVLSNLELKNINVEKVGKRISKYRLRDEDIHFSINNDRSKWIFQDFDQIFDSAVAATGSIQSTYDIFGHSAGGQILHRLVIFNPGSKADKILAANSGFYTLPSHSYELPFGINGIKLTSGELEKSFSTKLILLLGEKDDGNETRGTMLHTPMADRQGMGRYSRGMYFFDQSRKEARALNSSFKWQVEVIKAVGHDYRKMGKAAARLLYGEN